MPAIAGLARDFQRGTLKGGTYLAGLWRELFPGALLWRVRRERQLGDPGETHPFAAFEPRRPMRYRAPSWSWAYLDGEITYASQRIPIEEHMLGPNEAPKSRVELRGASLDVADPYLLQVSHKVSITLHGQITQATFEYVPHEPLERNDYKRQLYNHDGDMIGFFYLDIIFEVQFAKDISLLGSLQ